MFAALGVPVIDTDQVAREVVEPGRPGLQALTDAFGNEILQSDGRLDRRLLRQRVFADPAQRHRLEGLLHPLIRNRTLELAAAAGGRYQVLVVPLLAETGFAALVDRVLVVDCPEETQRRRLLARDAETAAQADRIMAAQLGRDARLAVADDVIDNAGSLDSTRRQVETLHQRYLALAASPRS